MNSGDTLLVVVNFLVFIVSANQVWEEDRKKGWMITHSCIGTMALLNIINICNHSQY